MSESVGHSGVLPTVAKAAAVGDPVTPPIWPATDSLAMASPLPDRRIGDFAAGCPVSPVAGSTVADSPPAGSAVVAELAGLVERVGGLPAAVDDVERIDRIAVLERLRGAVAAAQARETVEFAASQLAAQAAAGVRASRRGRGIAEQVGSPGGCRRRQPRTRSSWPGTGGCRRCSTSCAAATLRSGPPRSLRARPPACHR